METVKKREFTLPFAKLFLYTEKLDQLEVSLPKKPTSQLAHNSKYRTNLKISCI